MQPLGPVFSGARNPQENFDLEVVQTFIPIAELEAAALFAVACLASVVPARRAVHVDPVIALRDE